MFERVTPNEFQKILNYPDTKLQIDQILHSFLLKLVHIGLIQSIFTYTVSV